MLPACTDPLAERWIENAFWPVGPAGIEVAIGMGGPRRLTEELAVIGPTLMLGMEGVE